MAKEIPPTLAQVGYAIRCMVLDAMKLWHSLHRGEPTVLKLPHAAIAALVSHLQAEFPRQKWTVRRVLTRGLLGMKVREDPSGLLLA